MLHERLHRVAIGLALGEELLSLTLEQLATTRSNDAGGYRMQANRARIAAEECRTFAQRLDELNPDAATDRRSRDPEGSTYPVDPLI